MRNNLRTFRRFGPTFAKLVSPNFEVPTSNFLIFAATSNIQAVGFFSGTPANFGFFSVTTLSLSLSHIYIYIENTNKSITNSKCALPSKLHTLIRSILLPESFKEISCFCVAYVCLIVSVLIVFSYALASFGGFYLFFLSFTLSLLSYPFFHAFRIKSVTYSWFLDLGIFFFLRRILL
jgi:hypothetical protein